MNATVRSINLDQVYSNTRVPTQVNKSQYESTRINTNLTQVNTSPTRVNTHQHESKTGLDQILLKIYEQLDHKTLFFL